MECLFRTSNLEFIGKIRYPNLEIPTETFAFLTGESGCGKSSLLRILNGSVKESSGEIFYRETQIKDLEIISHRRECVLVPQEVFLVEGSIRDNFKFYYDSREEQLISDEVICKFLRICELDFPPENDCSRFSGGEKQRLFLAIFLSFGAKTLLLDEVTSSLDINSARAVLSNIKEFCKKERISAISVCHSEELTAEFSELTIKL